MTIIEKIRVKIFKNDFELSPHAVNQSIVPRIRVQELREAIMTGEVIEEYPDDKYCPSCLIFGLTIANRPLHVQWSYPSPPLVKIITLYEPDPKIWIDFNLRINQNEQ
ncbi:DUF4258 domain-containing protein [Microcoleus sp. Pol12B5]|uniref:DUF4258 domain-containing protein n=1 Tax=Microcoleus sp. Pol12B5 TaxID=3055396 RepID=UPI002FD587F1